MPPQYDDLLELIGTVVANDTDNSSVCGHVVRLLSMSWPDWERHVIGGEQELLRLIQQARAKAV
jgi:hypothetical protein